MLMSFNNLERKLLYANNDSQKLKEKKKRKIMIFSFLAKRFAISRDCLSSSIEVLGAIYQEFLEVGQAWLVFVRLFG